MSISLGANGGSYSYPQENDPAGWGDDATNWASAVSAALGNIGLGGTVSATSLIDMSGTTTKGFLPPKLTTVQRNAIATPPAGLVIYNTTTSQLEVYTGSSWFSVASNINGNLTVTGNATVNGNATLGDAVGDTTAITGILNVDSGVLYVDPTNNRVGVNITSPTVALEVSGASKINGALTVTGNTTLVNVTGANITSTGTILAASGTSGSPGISFSGDNDTGIYNSAANQISFSTGGNERFRIESTGQIKAVYESTLGTDYNTTLDNGYLCRAWVNFDGTSSNLTGTYSRTGTTITVSITSHGLSNGQSVYLDFTTGGGTDGIYIVTVVNANSYTVTDTVSGSTSGNVTQFRYIRASGNVSSITDNGIGDYTVNFTTALPDTNYSVVFGGRVATSGARPTGYNLNRTITNSTFPVAITTGDYSGFSDSNDVFMAVFR